MESHNGGSTLCFSPGFHLSWYFVNSVMTFLLIAAMPKVSEFELPIELHEPASSIDLVMFKAKATGNGSNRVEFEFNKNSSCSSSDWVQRWIWQTSHFWSLRSVHGSKAERRLTGFQLWVWCKVSKGYLQRCNNPSAQVGWQSASTTIHHTSWCRQW